MKPTRRINLIGSALEVQALLGLSTRGLSLRKFGLAFLAIVLVGMALWSTPADAGEPAELVWSADMTVVEYSSVSMGAASADLFSNVGGSGNLQIKSLWSHIPGRDLRLAFEEGVPNAADYTLQVGGLSLEFPEDSSGASSFKWNDVDVDWEDGQLIRVRIVPTAEGDAQQPNTPATGVPAISGTAQVGETLAADTSGIADADGLSDVSYAYQWIRTDGGADADIAGATDSTYTLTNDDAGKTIKLKVWLIDDNGNSETLTSAATAAVASRPNTPATGLPTINGTPQVDETLAADTSGITDADGLTNASYSYQWIRNDGTNNSDIGGQTGSTYTLVSADEGKTIKVKVSFTDDADNEETLTSAATVAVASRPNSPATGAPTISGTVQVDETLTADTSGITDADGLTNASYSYQWIRNDGTNDSDIGGQTGSTYTLVSADEGKTIKVKVSFTDDADNEETLTSAATMAVAAAPSRLTVSLENAATTHDGSAVFTFEVRFSEEFPLSYTTLKFRAFDVTGGEVLNAQRMDKPSNIRWLIKVRPDSNGDVTVVLPVTEDCAAQGAICTEDGRPLSNRLEMTVTGPLSADQNTEATGAPTISGTAQVDETLTADTSGITDADGLTNVSYSYQWIRNDGTNDADIGGQTGSTYTLVSADEGKSIKVRVTFTDDAGNEETLTSAATAAVAAKPNSPATGAPTISGTAQAGEMLTANISGIADEDGLENAEFSYQWIRTDGGTDADIAGATESTYTLTDDDEGKTIKLKVRFIDDKGTSETLTSAATADVGEPQFLVSNLGAGVSGAGGIQRTLYTARFGFAQAFTTGAKTGGYPLGSVGIQVSHFYDGSTVGDHLQVTINGVASEGEPGDAHCTLTNPSSFSTPGVSAFEAPTGAGSCAQLATETTYFVVIEWVDPSGTDHFALIPQTYPTEESAATEEDPGGAEGWSIADQSYYLTVSSDARTWAAYDETASFKIVVKEAAVTAAKANSPATGAPTISGTAQAGETLTADTSPIADEDGLENVSYSYQWIRRDGTTDTNIEGATDSTYGPSDDDEGKSVRVRVSFTDDQGNEETLTSAATAAVVAKANRAPTFATTTTSRSIAENSEAGTAVGDPVVATDEDEDSLTYTLDGPGMTTFGVDASGQLRVAEGAVLDYESRATYTVEVVATDTAGQSATVTVSIAVTDVTDPNIVLIVADEVGYEAVGAYGSTQYRTPRLDGLAGAGVRFTHAYSKPATTASRIALMTGMSNVRNYVDRRTLLPGEYTIADLFGDAGYVTAIAGKWQLQGRTNFLSGVAADASGFDTYCLWRSDNPSRRYWRPKFECDGQVIDYARSDYGPDELVGFLQEFIESNRNRPFFAYYSMLLPHSPFDALPPIAQCADANSAQCVFEDMVAYLDYNVGRVYDKLEALGLLDNTVFLFTSDNGTPASKVSQLDGETIHGSKGMPTDGGTHVPLIVLVPGAAGGQIIDDLIDFTDFLPTLADAAGLTIPNRDELDGVSFWERLQGNPGQPRDWIYTYYFPQPYVTEFDTPSAHPESSYARDKRYKLYSTGELFDVSADRHELRPLPADDEESSAARTTLQAALDSMPEAGQEIRWSSVTATASEPRPRWRPTLLDATVNRADLTLSYVGSLDTTVNPQASAFTVQVDGLERTVVAVLITSRTVTLTLASPVAVGQTVTVSYTPGTSALQHANRAAWHLAAALTNEAVSNLTDHTDATVDPPSLTVEQDGTGEYTIVLTGEPTADVTIMITAGTGVTTNPSSLAFTPQNWNTVQTVTVTGLENADAQYSTVTITHTVAPGSAPEYMHVTIGDVTVTVEDKDQAPTPATGAPTIGGTAQAGKTLTADISGIEDADGLDNATFSYQWVSNDGNTDTDIEGATGSTYDLSDDDVGKTINVRVSFTDDAGNEESLTSEATAEVTARPNSSATGAPTISGTVQAGETLTADTSGITDADGLTNVSYSYQWLADDADIQDGQTGFHLHPDGRRRGEGRSSVQGDLHRQRR